MRERKERGSIVAEYNGQVFRFNELVHVLEGTGQGVPEKKTELMKAWLKGFDAKEDKFICRPVVGYSRGSFPRFSKGAVFKLKVFGVSVLEERGRRNRWERMKPEVQER